MNVILKQSGPSAGIPLMLLHGFPMDSTIWDGVVARHPGRIITVDYLGFGKSEGAATASLESVAVDLRRALLEINALPCVIAGLSMGGYLALAFAAQFPADLAGLVLVDSKATADDASAKQRRDRMLDVLASKGVPGVAQQMLPKMFGSTTGPSVQETFHQLMLASPPQAIANALTAMRDRHDYSATFACLKCPRLIVAGQEDQLISPETVVQLQQSNPGTEVIFLCGAGHLTPIEQPEQVAFAIGFFMDRRIK